MCFPFHTSLGRAFSIFGDANDVSDNTSLSSQKRPLTGIELRARIFELEKELEAAQGSLTRNTEKLEAWKVSAQARIEKEKKRADDAQGKAETAIRAARDKAAVAIRKEREKSRLLVERARAQAAKRKPAEDEDVISCDLNAVMQAIAEIDAKSDSSAKEKAKLKAEAMLIAIPPRAFLIGMIKKVQDGDAKAMGLYMQALGLLTKEAQEGETAPLAPVFNLTVLTGGAPERDAKTFDIPPEKPTLTITG